MVSLTKQARFTTKGTHLPFRATLALHITSAERLDGRISIATVFPVFKGRPSLVNSMATLFKATLAVFHASSGELSEQNSVKS